MRRAPRSPWRGRRLGRFSTRMPTTSASAVTDTEAELAAGGAHLDAQGEVRAAAPAAPWEWADGFLPLPKRQRGLSRALEVRDRADFLASLGHEDAARVRSCGGPGAGGWLTALPVDAALRFDDGAYQIATRLRLGQHVLLGGERCANEYTGIARDGAQRRATTCPGRLDSRGVHALACLVGGGPRRRHDGLRDLHATLLHLLGIDHERFTFKFQGRRYRLTDVHGEVVKGILG